MLLILVFDNLAILVAGFCAKIICNDNLLDQDFISQAVTQNSGDVEMLPCGNGNLVVGSRSTRPRK